MKVGVPSAGNYRQLVAHATSVGSFTDPMTTTGDTIYEDTGPQRLPIGTAPQLLGITAGLPAWITPTIRAAAGVPSGAPTGTELPIAFDSTVITGGVYYWTGAAWVKGGTI